LYSLIQIFIPHQIFILYSEKQLNSLDCGGLGFVDSNKDLLEIKFDISFKSPPGDSESPHRKLKAKQVEKTVEIELHQDKTALRSRKGDTGSVVWRARYHASAKSYAKFY
jgi:hypothetical protein